MELSLFDRVLGAVAPRTAARRLYSKVQLEQARAYAGAAGGRHTEGWRANASSADTEIAAAGSKLRDRSRDLTRNNPHAAKALSSWVSNLVGDGIMPRIKDAKLKALFEAWSTQCDADGQLNWYGLQTLAAREMIEAGEVLVRRRARFASDGLAVPLQVQILEADFLDGTKTGEVTQGRGVTINGVEFDAIGRRTRYWMFQAHPGNTALTLKSRVTSVPVPASEIVHLYEKQRTQTRGVPWCSPILRQTRDLDDYEFAEMLRKKMESCVVGVVTGFDELEQGMAPSVVDAKGKVIEKFQPGMIAYARGGKQITFNTPGGSGGYSDYKKLSLKTIAAGYRLPYELLSGDLSEVNYSSIRAGLVEYRRLVSAMQWQLFIPVYCQQLWDWFCEAAFLAGSIDQPKVAVDWSAPKFFWVDPYKDILADILAMRAGIRSYPDVIAETGRDPDQVLAEIVAWNKKFDDGDVILDSDPRHTAKTGVVQNAADGNAGGDAAGPPQDKTKPARGDEDENLLATAVAYALTREREPSEFERNMPELIDAIRSQRPPIVRTPITVAAPAAPAPAPIPPKRAERTVIKRDANGCMIGLERREID